MSLILKDHFQLFNFARFQFNLKAVDPIVLPSYKGSTLRGAFGHAFKKVVCALRGKECPECLLREKCIYSYVFETPPPSGSTVMRKYTAAPHPFILEPPPERTKVYKPGDFIIFGLTLIGRAIEYLPYFIYAFDELGQKGLGKGRGRFCLDCVKSLSADGSEKEGDVIYNAKNRKLLPVSPSTLSEMTEVATSSSISIEFKTPTRITYNGSLTLDLEFHILIRQLLRRFSMLCYFHCGIETSEWDFKGIIEQAKNVPVVDRDLRWYDWQRYSNRQHTKMSMGGFVGKISFEGPVDHFMPLIRAGKIVHVGKGTSFGLGKYGLKSLNFVALEKRNNTYSNES